MSEAPRRRWLSFSLRSLLVLVTLVAIGIGWVTHEWRQSQYEQLLAEQFRADQSFVVQFGDRFDSPSLYMARADGRGGSTLPWWRRTLSALCGPRIQVLAPGDKYLLNHDLSEFEEMKCLLDVRLGASHVRDLSPLVGKCLVDFRLIGSEVEDLSPIARITSLRHLRVYDSPVRDVSALAGLDNLLYLYLEQTPLRDIKPLGKLKNLRLLSLNATEVSDLSPLADLENLQTLRLRKSRVHDLSPLVKLTNLRELRVQGTPVREEQIDMLQDALPNCKIVSDFSAEIPAKTPWWDSLVE